MDFLLFIPIGLLYFFVFSFTGGFAGAIHAQDREDRSLVTNAGIGLGGWTAAALIWTMSTGEWPEEFTFGLGGLAMVCSIVVVHLLERRQPAQRLDSAISKQ
jgi:peptidoglycan/LPS O-acetylase OafA/YrhL